MRWAEDVRSTGTCVFKLEGGKLTGSCGDSTRFPITGQADGSKVSWQFDVAQDGPVAWLAWPSMRYFRLRVVRDGGQKNTPAIFWWVLFSCL